MIRDKLKRREKGNAGKEERKKGNVKKKKEHM
jgi:hypothetical protein